jgi:hypothetical protein
MKAAAEAAAPFNVYAVGACIASMSRIHCPH